MYVVLLSHKCKIQLCGQSRTSIYYGNNNRLSNILSSHFVWIQQPIISRFRFSDLNPTIVNVLIVQHILLVHQKFDPVLHVYKKQLNSHQIQIDLVCLMNRIDIIEKHVCCFRTTHSSVLTVAAWLYR